MSGVLTLLRKGGQRRDFNYTLYRLMELLYKGTMEGNKGAVSVVENADDWALWTDGRFLGTVREIYGMYLDAETLKDMSEGKEGSVAQRICVVCELEGQEGCDEHNGGIESNN